MAVDVRDVVGVVDEVREELIVCDEVRVMVGVGEPDRDEVPVGVTVREEVMVGVSSSSSRSARKAMGELEGRTPDQRRKREGWKRERVEERDQYESSLSSLSARACAGLRAGAASAALADRARKAAARRAGSAPRRGWWWLWGVMVRREVGCAEEGREGRAR